MYTHCNILVDYMYLNKHVTTAGCQFYVDLYPPQHYLFLRYVHYVIIEAVDSINRDEGGFPLTQYITNGGISSARNTSTHFKHHHRFLRLISNRMSV